MRDNAVANMLERVVEMVVVYVCGRHGFRSNKYVLQKFHTPENGLTHDLARYTEYDFFSLGFPLIMPTEITTSPSAESLPYWLVNVPRAEWPAECPDFLRDLPAKSILCLSTPDELYQRQKWDFVKESIGEHRVYIYVCGLGFCADAGMPMISRDEST